MKIPSYDRQNKWIGRYVSLIESLDIKGLLQSYKTLKREDLRDDMEEAGVFDSLNRLETEGTSFDKVMAAMQKGIADAAAAVELQKAYAENAKYRRLFRELDKKDGFFREFNAEIGFLKKIDGKNGFGEKRDADFEEKVRQFQAAIRNDPGVYFEKCIVLH